MLMMDLSSYGYNVVLEFEGEVLFQRCASHPLIFLFDEDHESAQGIGASIRNALRLLDAGVVDFLGVEETPTGVRENAERLVTQVFHPKYDSLEAYSASLRKHFAGSDAAMIDAASAKPDFRFGKTLLFLRPAVKMRSVDDVELCRIAQAEHDRLLETYDSDTPEAILALRRAYGAHQVHRQRDRVFAERLLQFYQEEAAARAMILNAGGSHQQRIVQYIPDDVSIIRLRPPDYHDSSAE